MPGRGPVVMMGEPSIDMSQTPPQERSTRTGARLGNSASISLITSSTMGRLPRWA